MSSPILSWLSNNLLYLPHVLLPIRLSRGLLHFYSCLITPVPLSPPLPHIYGNPLTTTIQFWNMGAQHLFGVGLDQDTCGDTFLLLSRAICVFVRAEKRWGTRLFCTFFFILLCFQGTPGVSGSGNHGTGFLSIWSKKGRGKTRDMFTLTGAAATACENHFTRCGILFWNNKGQQQPLYCSSARKREPWDFFFFLSLNGRHRLIGVRKCVLIIFLSCAFLFF